MKHSCLALLYSAALLPSAICEEVALMPRFDYGKMLEEHSPAKNYSAHEMVSLGEAAVRLWRKTQQPALKQQALAYFDAALAMPNFTDKGLLKDFHVLQGFARLTFLLHEENLLDPKRAAAVRTLAEPIVNGFVKSTDFGDYNIRLAQVLGYACFWRALGEPKEWVPVKQKLDEYWALVRDTGDLDEDASNYDSLGAVFMLELARVMGWENDLRDSPKFRRLFERFRDVVSPSGLIAEVGDAYFGYTGVAWDRVYLLEYGAQLFNDPTMLWAAQRLASRPSDKAVKSDVWFRSLGQINLPESPLKAVAPASSPSLVTYRLRRGTPGELVDKLILRSGREPGDAMVLLDLYAHGSHAHKEKGPSIAYYEVGQVPLFHNLGRHGVRSAITGNLPWALPAEQRFPGSWNQANQWFTMTIPVEYLTQEGGSYRLTPCFSLRNFQDSRSGHKDLLIDNLRLEGPAGTRLVDDFDEVKGWQPSFLKLSAVTPDTTDKTQGEASLRMPWKGVTSNEFRRTFPHPYDAPFTSAEYTALKLDVKYTGTRPYMHIRGIGEQVDLGDQLLVTRIAAARTEQHGRDALGQVTYSSYINSDTTLVRRIVLTAEGVLVVQDELRPGASMKGWNAGDLWQLYALKTKGTNWFCAEDDGTYATSNGTVPPLRMLVRFASDRGATCDAEEVLRSYHCPTPNERKPERFFTSYTVRPITPGQVERFNFVVLPHAPSAAPGPLAEAIHFQQTADGTSVTTVPVEGGKTVEVRISDKNWEVKR